MRRRAKVSRRAAGAPAAAVVAVVAGAMLAGGCGLPRDEAPRPVTSDLIPFGLPGPSPTTDAAFPGAGDLGGRVALLGPGDRLVFVQRSVSAAASDVDELTQLLQALAAGANGLERGRGLSSALPPGAQLRVADLTDGVVTVEISGDSPDAAPERLPLAVAQVVLTATSLPAVEAVRLSRDGSLIEAPLPAGALSSQPLVEGDYAGLLAPSRTTRRPATPTPGAP